MSFRLIADRIARIARAATHTGSESRSRRDALREAEELIAREREAEQALRRKQNEARRTPAPKVEPSMTLDPKVVAALAMFGLKPGATLVQITAEYRRRIVAMHPDRHAADSSAATEKTQQLNAAYAVLKQAYKN